MKSFRKTLLEEVFSKKVGENPPLILNPEEVPIIADVLDDSKKNEKEKFAKVFAKPKAKGEIIGSDDEIKPENYFFSSDT